jgi:hypothetical protein
MQWDPVGNRQQRRKISITLGWAGVAAVLWHPPSGFGDVVIYAVVAFVIMTCMFYIIFTILSWLPKDQTAVPAQGSTPPQTPTSRKWAEKSAKKYWVGGTAESARYGRELSLSNQSAEEQR